MADHGQIELLKQGAKKWNHWREKNSSASLDLSDSYLSYANLSNADLSNVNLSDSYLSNANLSNANLSNVNLSNADLSDSNLIEADLSNANLSNADLSYAHLSYANLSNAGLNHANLSYAVLIETKFIEADLSNADLSNADLNKAKFIKAKLSNADLSNSIFSNSDFSKAKLSNADLSNSIFSNSDFSKAKLSYSNLSYSDFSKANLCNTYLNTSNLSKADISNANLRGANLSKADISNANLRGANLIKANLSNASLRGANLRGADLSSADFTKANIESTTLDYAVVDGKTWIANCGINDSTYAHGVGLDSARIEESLKARLKKNIRKKYWTEKYPYYFNHRSIQIYLKSIPKYLKILLTPESWYLGLKILWSCVVRAFWWTSDYGSSTTRLLQSFLITSVIYTFIYFVPVCFGSNHFFIQGIQFSEVIDSTGKSVPYTFNLWGILLRAFYFSVVTMTTLGFGDISANPASTCGHFLVISQVLIGYVLLGALITRLSILFQDVG